MMTFSPLGIRLPCNSTSEVVVLRISGSGVCQRMISGTRESTSDGFSRSFCHSSGRSCKARSPPEMEFRVVSLPPTIKRINVPISSWGSIAAISECASIEIMSDRTGSFARCARSAEKVVTHGSSSSRRWASEITGPSGDVAKVATSDHQVSLRLSSKGKSKRVASI